MAAADPSSESSWRFQVSNPPESFPNPHVKKKTKKQEFKNASHLSRCSRQSSGKPETLDLKHPNALNPERHTLQVKAYAILNPKP